MGCLYQLTSSSGKSYVGITTKTAENVLRSMLNTLWDGAKTELSIRL
jgi:hypothetical protein